MLNEFFSFTQSRDDYAHILAKVNLNVDHDAKRGGRAWAMIRDHLLDVGLGRGWDTTDSIWDNWSPVQQQEFLSMIKSDREKKTGGCYVATAVYGTYECPELWILRRFRDQMLSTNMLGRSFIRTYLCVEPDRTPVRR
jgi:hypothetical protein